ncbi:MAG: hypothetical protein KGJ90_00200 [Patescibacteria group bacterium]|nr:hypothetical protein [Patescibacteria group bacterium]
MSIPDFLIWHCVGCDAPAEGKKKPCDCATNVGARRGPNGKREQTWWDDPAPAETGWLIEREDSDPSRPMYYAGTEWSYDNLKAIRFARREDAERMSRYMFPGEPHRIADHMWCP